MGWLDRLRGKPAPRPYRVDTAAVADSVLHPSSFSLVVFDGDHSAEIPDLLAACGYQILDRAATHGTPIDLMERLGAIRGPNRSIVSKAYWASPRVTVLVDPEMIVSSARDEQLINFCREHNTMAWAALWERVSETAILTEISGDGILRQTWYERGAPLATQLAPRAEVASSPDGAGLRAAMAACGVPVDDVFADVAVTVLELQE
jgi:hypothetical protein